VIEDRCEQLKLLGLEIDGLQADTLALVNFVAHEFHDDWSEEPDDDRSDDENAPAVLLVDCGASATNMIVVSAESQWVWTLESGGEDMTAMIARPTKKMLSEAEKLKRNPADLAHPARDYRGVEQRQEVSRVRIEAAFGEAMKQNKRLLVQRSFCCGGGCLAHAWVRRVMLSHV
jgi:Tfp pilus assembly PilM family ATPase